MTTLDEAREVADRLDTPGPGFIPAARAAQVIRELCERVEARNAALDRYYYTLAWGNEP